MRSCLVSVDQEMLRGAIIVRLVELYVPHGDWLVVIHREGLFVPTLARTSRIVRGSRYCVSRA